VFRCVESILREESAADGVAQDNTQEFALGFGSCLQGAMCVHGCIGAASLDLRAQRKQGRLNGGAVTCRDGRHCTVQPLVHAHRGCSSVQ
jgi:hypothetical protein